MLIAASSEARGLARGLSQACFDPENDIRFVKAPEGNCAFGPVNIQIVSMVIGAS
jgi:hypothetical protein